MDFTVLVRFGLVLLRIGTLVVVAPVLGGTFVPAPVKIGVSVLVTIVLLPVVAVPDGITGGLVLVAARECAIGLALALSLRVLVAAAELGGYLIGFQLGFAYAGIVDPQSGVRNNVIAAMYGTLTLIALLGVNAHHVLLRVLARSYDLLPVGAGGVEQSIPATVASMLGTVFYLGARLAAPVVLVLCLVELLLGVITRAAPSLNMMAVSAPVRLLVGLGALAAGVQVVPAVVTPMVRPAIELGVRLAGALR